MTNSAKIGKAGFYLLSRKIWGAITNIFVLSVLTRLLSKEDFGLIVLSTVLVEIMRVFAVSGISDYIVYSKNENVNSEISAIFWMTILLISLVGVVLLIITPYWVAFYDEPRLEPLILWSYISFIFTTLSSIPYAIFRKNIEYSFPTKVQTVIDTLTKFGQITLAFIGFGVYSIVIPIALFGIFQTVIFYRRTRISLNCNFDFIIWKRVFKYSRSIIGAEIINKFLNEGDKILIGKFLGKEILGVYDIAFKLANLINSQLVPIVTNVSFPVFSKVNGDIVLMKRFFFDFIRVLSNSFLPLYTVLFLLSNSIVFFLYGEKWTDSILPLKFLIVIAALRSLSSPASGLYNAMGKPRIGFVFTAVFTSVHFCVIYLTLQVNSFLAVLIAISVTRNIGSLTHFFILSKILHFKMSEILKLIMPNSISLTISIIITFLINCFIEMSEIGNFIVFFLCYIPSILVFFRGEVNWYFGTMKKMLLSKN